MKVQRALQSHLMGRERTRWYSCCQVQAYRTVTAQFVQVLQETGGQSSYGYRGLGAGWEGPQDAAVRTLPLNLGDPAWAGGRTGSGVTGLPGRGRLSPAARMGTGWAFLPSPLRVSLRIQQQSFATGLFLFVFLKK